MGIKSTEQIYRSDAIERLKKELADTLCRLDIEDNEGLGDLLEALLDHGPYPNFSNFIVVDDIEIPYG